MSSSLPPRVRENSRNSQLRRKYDALKYTLKNLESMLYDLVIHSGIKKVRRQSSKNCWQSLSLSLCVCVSLALADFDVELDRDPPRRERREGRPRRKRGVEMRRDRQGARTCSVAYACARECACRCTRGCAHLHGHARAHAVGASGCHISMCLRRYHLHSTARCH